MVTMQIAMLKSKLHRATVTGADLNYEGSISIDTELIDKARLRVNEKVDIYNCNTGTRFSTSISLYSELNGQASTKNFNIRKFIHLVIYSMNYPAASSGVSRP
jgi:aspartate 1-decarboxylase